MLSESKFHLIVILGILEGIICWHMLRDFGMKDVSLHVFSFKLSRFSWFFFNNLKDRGKRKRLTERFMSDFSFPKACSSGAWGRPELGPGLPHGWQVPNSLDKHLLPPMVHITKKQNREMSYDTNPGTVMGNIHILRTVMPDICPNHGLSNDKLISVLPSILQGREVIKHFSMYKVVLERSFDFLMCNSLGRSSECLALFLRSPDSSWV